MCVFKEIDPLPPIDHSDYDYEKFSKNFYEEPVDITKLSEDEVTALRSKLDIRVGIIVSQDLKISKIITLNAPIATKVICFSRLLNCLRSLYGKQCGPRSDCPYPIGAVCSGSTLFILYLICQ